MASACSSPAAIDFIWDGSDEALARDFHQFDDRVAGIDHFAGSNSTNSYVPHSHCNNTFSYSS
jgi:hypothetical protein